MIHGRGGFLVSRREFGDSYLLLLFAFLTTRNCKTFETIEPK